MGFPSSLYHYVLPITIFCHLNHRFDDMSGISFEFYAVHFVEILPTGDEDLASLGLIMSKNLFCNIILQNRY